MTAPTARVPYELLSPARTSAAKDPGKTLTLVAKSAGTPTDAVVADAASWAAGDVAVDTSVSHTVTFTNAGDVDVPVGEVDADGDDAFEVTGGTCAAGLVLAPGATCTAVVTFAPERAGAASATLTLWPQGDADEAVVALSGNGIVPPPDSDDADPAPGSTGSGGSTGSTGSAGSTGGASTPGTPVAGAPASRTRSLTVGPLTAALLKAPALKGTAIQLGAFTCASRCRLKISGRITVSGKKTEVALTKVLPAKKATTLTIKVSSLPAEKLKKTGKGTLSLRYSVGGRSKVVSLKVTA
ncbi:hypothetical protein [Baekduia sp. Peel2402]|uniref:hypothetical protein n=1 Tax=Baekduia sp. Peel2402 TaxID=3458296 RepID=UPI00403EB40D